MNDLSTMLRKRYLEKLNNARRLKEEYSLRAQNQKYKNLMMEVTKNEDFKGNGNGDF